MPAATTPQRTTRRARRWLLGAGVALVLIASVVVVVSVGMARMSPSWWRTTRPDNPETIETAVAIENDLANVIYAARDDQHEVWAAALRAPDANAWLNTRLAQWLTNSDAEFEWPDQFRDLQVEFDEGFLHLGVRVLDEEGGSRVLSMTLRPEFDGHGSLWVRVDSMHLGRLPIPAGWVVDRAGDLWREVLPGRVLEEPMTEHLIAALAGRIPLDTEPVLDLGDGRQVRLLDLTCERGQLWITCRTERGD